MILARAIKHMRQQHWTGVFIELVIVVLGVFIVLRGNHGNQARTQRLAEIGYLGLLGKDVGYSTVKLQQWAWNLERQRAFRDRLLIFLPDTVPYLN
jgi:hypothetical protein